MKRFLLLVSAALFVILPLSCSEEGFKAPSLPPLEGGVNAAEKIPCIVNENQCYEISRSTCSSIGGSWGDTLNPQIETCKVVEIKDVELVRESIVDASGDTLYFINFKGTVEVIDISAPLDSIRITSHAGFEISYAPVATGDWVYDFATKVTPINLKDIDCGENGMHGISISIFAGGRKQAQQLNREFKMPSSYCKEPYPIPDFTCGWEPGRLKYGKKAALYLSNWDLNCEKRVYAVSSKGDTTWFVESEYAISTKNGFPKMGDFATRGVVVCEDPTRKGISEKACEVLTIDSVPEPIATGELSFKKPDLTEGGNNFYFVGTPITRTDIESSIEITNKTDVECGELDIRITGSTAAAGNTITATAFVVCGEDETEYELGSSISATVLPDYVVEECSFTKTSTSLITKGDTLTNLDTLFLKSSIKNNYGRCTKVEYSLNGTNGWSASDTLSLEGSSGRLSNITTKVTCGTKIHEKKCSTVTVVNYAKIEICHNPRVQVGPGLTIVEINCYNDNNPANIATNFGCDCNGEDWDTNNYFTLNGVKATEGGGCWTSISLPSASTDANRRQFLVNYKKEIGCVAY
jgi:hypothetical protein